uniref:Uncharacterized protein n=1 Tax=Panagrolaimus superbus TaxID=310955 RepID=A0A914YFN1_9BILA
MQVGGVVAPVAPVTLDADQEAVELVGVVGHTRADVPCAVTQARRIRQRVVRMPGIEHRRAVTAAGVLRAAGEAPATGHAGRGIAEDGFLLRVADLGVDLAAFAEGERGAAEHVDVLLFRGQVAILLRWIPQAALGRRRGFGLARNGAQVGAARKGDQVRRRRIIVEHRAVRADAAVGTAAEVGAAEELRVGGVIAPRARVAGADPLAVLAVADLDRVGLADIQAEECVPAILGQVAGTGGQGGLLGSHPRSRYAG